MSYEKITVERCTEFCVKAFGETLAHGRFVAHNFEMNSRDQLAAAALRAGLTGYLNGEKTRQGRKWVNMEAVPGEKEGKILLDTYREMHAEQAARDKAKAKKARALGKSIRKERNLNITTAKSNEFRVISGRLTQIERKIDQLLAIWSTEKKVN